MAAYAALVTLMHTIQQIQDHPRPPISFDKNQVQSLTAKINFLQKFLEDYSHEAGVLESRIADAAGKAEEIIESYVVHQIFAECERTSRGGKNERISLLKVIVDQINVVTRMKFHIHLPNMMDGIIIEAMKIKQTTAPIQVCHHVQILPRSTPFTPGQNEVVCFQNVLFEILEKLIGEESSRQIIPIVGMGGIGKTTLAGSVYSNALVEEHFDVRAWTTISQEYNMRETFLQLSQIGKRDREDLQKMSENELKETLHKCLVGRRYLIIIDDIWNIEVWDKIGLFFPDSSNRSRVIITTRI